MKLLKNLEKGISNSLKDGATIEHLKVIVNPHINKFSTKELNILTILDKLPHLKVLDVSGVSLDINLIQRIKNHLYYYKKIKVLDLSYCNLDDNTCNELSDGVMKAKCLEKLYIPGNNLVKGLSSIIYNLAFQPCIKVLDASNNKKCDLNETAVSLHKLIKMSQTIENIIINNIPNLNGSLTYDFYNALGDNNNLLYLDLSKNGDFNDITQLGKAIAFNALKNGSLEYLDISSSFSNSRMENYNTFKSFINSMQISENEHNSWYGFQFNGNIAKDSPDYFKQVFHCKLKTLIIKNSSLHSYINFLSPESVNKDNCMKILLNGCQTLDTIILDNSSFNNNFIKSLSEAIKSPNNLQYLSLSNCSIKGETFKNFLPCFCEVKDKEINLENKIKIKKPKNKLFIDGEKISANPNFHIKGLDLSCNSFGYSSIFWLCQALKMNQTLEYLNLFHNCIDVSGAGQLGEVLKINNNIMELDVGYNRIKNNGFKKVIDGIKENKTSKLKKLGVKYNFIKDKAMEEQFDLIENTETISLEEIELKNNSFTSRFLTEFYQDKYKNMKKNIKTDVFYLLYGLEPERLERTVWLEKGDNDDEYEIYETILRLEEKAISKDNSHIGIPLAIKKIRGRKTGQKKDSLENNAFVEFIMPNSVNRMLKIGKSNQFILSGQKRNIYKAGTRLDYLVVKKKQIIK
jgi:Ran GTPase-activating protein (RanGAP) involved in mRNA processing and transport